jgi:hypothetical protein
MSKKKIALMVVLLFGTAAAVQSSTGAVRNTSFPDVWWKLSDFQRKMAWDYLNYQNLPLVYDNIYNVCNFFLHP